MSTMEPASLPLWYQINDAILHKYFALLVKTLVPTEIAFYLCNAEILNESRYKDYINDGVYYESRNRALLLYLQTLPDGLKHLILAMAQSTSYYQLASLIWDELKDLEISLCGPQMSQSINDTFLRLDEEHSYLNSSTLPRSSASSTSSSGKQSQPSDFERKPSSSSSSPSSSSFQGRLDDLIDRSLSIAISNNQMSAAQQVTTSHGQSFAAKPFHTPMPHFVVHNLEEVRSPRGIRLPLAPIITLLSPDSDSGEDGDQEEVSDLSSDDDSEAHQVVLAAIRKHHETSGLTPVPHANKYYSLTKRNTLRDLFDELSTLINGGFYREFSQLTQEVLKKHHYNDDILFMTQYLEASSYLWQNEYEQCDKVVKKAIVVSRRTSRPCRTLVEILSSQCWMFFQEMRLRKLKETVDEAIQIIEQNPTECTGMAAGWIYVDKARFLSALLSITDLRRLRRMRREAICCIEQALKHFQNDETKDKEFGIAFSTIMLASILLACGDRLQTIKFRPTRQDVDRARAFIHDVQDSTQGIPGVLLVHVYIALCDYQIRLGKLHYEKAKVEVQIALDMALDLNMGELAFYAEKRLDFLNHQCAPNGNPEIFDCIDINAESCVPDMEKGVANNAERGSIPKKVTGRSKSSSKKHDFHKIASVSPDENLYLDGPVYSPVISAVGKQIVKFIPYLLVVVFSYIGFKLFDL